MSTENMDISNSVGTGVSVNSANVGLEADASFLSNNGDASSSAVQFTSHHSRLIDTLTRIPAKVDEFRVMLQRIWRRTEWSRGRRRSRVVCSTGS